MVHLLTYTHTNTQSCTRAECEQCSIISSMAEMWLALSHVQSLRSHMKASGIEGQALLGSQATRKLFFTLFSLFHASFFFTPQSKIFPFSISCLSYTIFFSLLLLSFYRPSCNIVHLKSQDHWNVLSDRWVDPGGWDRPTWPIKEEIEVRQTASKWCNNNLLKCNYNAIAIDTFNDRMHMPMWFPNYGPS